MPTDKEVMQQALNALELCVRNGLFEQGSGVLRHAKGNINDLRARLAQPEYRRGDRLICIETDEHCVIHISGTNNQWIKFPDSHVGMYTNKQVSELFDLLPPQRKEEPEPVAWWHDRGDVVDLNVSGHGIPLYFAPPQREWHGLTDDEMLMIYGQDHVGKKYSLGRMVQAKLREKNT